MKAQLERGVIRDRLRASKAREMEARKARGDELAYKRAECAVARERIKQDCQEARAAIRARATGTIAREQADRRTLRGRAPKGEPMKRRYSRKESDSLAVHNIPAHLVDLFLELADQFSYELAPDARAEAFMEWAESHEREVVAWQAERFGGDEAFAADYLAYLERAS